MKLKAHQILRDRLAPLLVEERLKRNLQPEQIALVCDLSADTIKQIEKGCDMSFQKYRRLLRHYNKKIKLELVDYDTPQTQKNE